MRDWAIRGGMLLALLVGQTAAGAAGADPPLTPTQAMALPSALRAELQARVIAPQRSPQRRLDALLRYVFDPQGLALNYREDANATAAEAYAGREVNCLSFTLLFVAMAREAGLRAYAQEVSAGLAWRQHEGTLYRYSHINAGVRIGGQRYTVDVARDRVLAADRPQPISDRRLLAHYYNNLALARLEHADPTGARALMDAALDYDGRFATLWSNAGVIDYRAGDPAAAERAYRRALALAPEHPSALFNLIGLLRQRGDAPRAARLAVRLARGQRQDPLHHYLQGDRLSRDGHACAAVAPYRQAVRLQRGEPRFHTALARAYLACGERAQAQRALRRAVRLSRGEALEVLQRELAALAEPPG